MPYLSRQDSFNARWWMKKDVSVEGCGKLPIRHKSSESDDYLCSVYDINGHVYRMYLSTTGTTFVIPVYS
ncbi:hypothetical protein D3C74_49450 [compost metagenome]